MFEILECSHNEYMHYKRIQKEELDIYENIQAWGVTKLQNTNFLEEICGEYMKSLNEFDEFGDLTVKVISKNELDIKIADLENSIFDLKSHKLAEGVFQEDTL